MSVRTHRPSRSIYMLRSVRLTDAKGAVLSLLLAILSLGCMARPTPVIPFEEALGPTPVIPFEEALGWQPSSDSAELDRHDRRLPEEVTRLEALVDEAHASRDPRREAHSQKALARVLARLRAFDQALLAYKRALLLYDSIGDQSGKAAVWQDMCDLYVTQGQVGKCSQLLRNAFDVCPPDDVRGRAELLLYAGHLCHMVGDTRGALADYAQALPLFHAAEATLSDQALSPWGPDSRPHQGEVATLERIGIAHHALRELDEAIAAFKRALSLLPADEISDRRASLLHNLGTALADQGHLQDGRTYLERARALNHAGGAWLGEAAVLVNLASLANKMEGPQAAISYLEQALVLAPESRNVLEHLMFRWADVGEGELAIFFGKQAVDRLQQERAAFQELDAESQRRFLSAIERLIEGWRRSS